MREAVEVHAGEATAVHDLGGMTVTPGFIDPRGHLSGAVVAAVGAGEVPL